MNAQPQMPARLLALLTLAVLLLSGCALFAPPPGEAGIRLTLTRLGANDWQADYRFTQPVQAVQFERGAQLQRAGSWTLSGGELRWQQVAGQDRIVAADGSRFDQLRLRFQASDALLSRDYAFYLPMADEGAGFYIGHLLVRGLSRDDETPAAHAPLPLTKLIIHPRQGEYVFMANQPLATRLVVDWQDADGTYIYFGQTRPLATPGADILLDNHLPAWTQLLLRAELPQLVNHYETRFGRKLPWRPMLLANLDPRGNGADSKAQMDANGGALNGIVQLSLRGGQWQQASEAARRLLRSLLAHEVAHWWVGQQYKPADDAAYPWLHEGGAEALALETLRELGWLSAQQHQQERDQLLNRCLTGLADLARQQVPLRDAGKAGRGQVWYDCGALLLTASQYALATPGEPAPQARLWQALFDASEAHQRLFSPALLATLVEPARTGLGAQLSQFTDQVQADPAQAARELFALAGASFHPDEALAPEQHGLDFGRSLLFAFMAEDCRGRVSFNMAEKWFFVQGADSCATLKDASIPLQGFAGLRWQQGAQLARKVAGECASKGKVSAERVDNKTALSLKCPKQLPAWQPWHSLSDVATTRVEALPW